MVLAVVVAAAVNERLRWRERGDGNDAYNACNDDGDAFETVQGAVVVAAVPGLLPIIMV